jgi:hypothetical protein
MEPVVVPHCRFNRRSRRVRQDFLCFLTISNQKGTRTTLLYASMPFDIVSQDCTCTRKSIIRHIYITYVRDTRLVLNIRRGKNILFLTSMVLARRTRGPFDTQFSRLGVGTKKLSQVLHQIFGAMATSVDGFQQMRVRQTLHWIVIT